jgi:hypothetical protein
MIRAIEATGLKPVIDRTVELDAIAEAFRYQADGKHFGKICLSIWRRLPLIVGDGGATSLSMVERGALTTTLLVVNGVTAVVTMWDLCSLPFIA